MRVFHIVLGSQARQDAHLHRRLDCAWRDRCQAPLILTWAVYESLHCRHIIRIVPADGSLTGQTWYPPLSSFSACAYRACANKERRETRRASAHHQPTSRRFCRHWCPRGQRPAWQQQLQRL